MKSYKHFILAILAIIGVLAPCVVEVNMNKTHVQEVVQYTDLSIEDYRECVAEVAARMATKIEKSEEKSESVEVVDEEVTRIYHASDVVLPFEKRRTHQYYGRQAGGLPAESPILLAS